MRKSIVLSLRNYFFGELINLTTKTFLCASPLNGFIVCLWPAPSVVGYSKSPNIVDDCLPASLLL